MPGPVWYASYGSNLLRARFACYLEGGIPPGQPPESARELDGARDRTLPGRDMPHALPFQLYFARYSPSWKGAAAFIDTTPGAARTLGRRYLITWEQFEDVVAQENGRAAPGRLDIDPSALTEGAQLGLGQGWYSTLICLGADSGVPVVTFTFRERWESAAPSAEYLRVIIGGLRETYDLGDPEIVAYLGAAPGCSEALVRAAI